MSDQEQQDPKRTADQPLPNTQAPRAGAQSAAGALSPAEKSEPSGVPAEEQFHNADPNAPQTQVSPPGATQFPPEETGGVPATSLRQGPEDGTDEAREAAQIRNIPPPGDNTDDADPSS
jgi:hypothetical protein